jgi:CheY-like chemotaxis protein
LERSISGLGIGLALAKNLVEMHDGKLEAHSAGIGEGSEFIVRLPITGDVSAPSPMVPKVSVLPSPMPRRVLVVDDNRDSATSLAMLLKVTGHETLAAYGGIEAVEAAGTFKPDLVLLDLGLPKLNGYDAARKIREEPSGKGMILVALTGWGQPEDLEKSKAAGFNGHLVKPIDFAVLTKLLAQLELPQ